jgi:hypothetical protein
VVGEDAIAEDVSTAIGFDMCRPDQFEPQVAGG